MLFLERKMLMNFIEYKEMMKAVPFTETLTYAPALYWLHPEILPVGVVSIGDESSGIVKIPPYVDNRYGRRVPVVAVRRDAFTGHTEVTDIVLPPTLRTIPAGAFEGCSELRRITIPKAVNAIGEGTFAGCDKLEDVYYEGTMEEWNRIDILHRKHEIEFGPLIPGTPVHEIRAERMRHVPGNEALFACNIHFRCNCSDWDRNPVFRISAAGKDVTSFFRTM